MSETGGLRYVVSCGLLTLPILAWNLIFARFLPPPLASPEFERDIPRLVAYGENALRVVVMVLPFLMPLDLATLGQRRGLLLFAAGTLLYFLAWVPLMIVPQSLWSTSWPGFVAPAYTPLIWLAGIGFTGGRLYGSWTLKPWIYIGLACAFVAFHVTHTSIVYARTYQHHAANEDTARSGSASSGDQSSVKTRHDWQSSTSRLG